MKRAVILAIGRDCSTKSELSEKKRELIQAVSYTHLDGTYGLKLLDDASKLGESYTISFAMKASEAGSAVNPTITAGTFSPEYWLNLRCV